MKHKATEPRSAEEAEKDFDRVTYAVIGAAIEVHRVLGPGFLESVYQAALEIELGLRGLRFDRQLVVPIEYKGTIVTEHILDLIVEGEVVVELKATESLHPVHCAQVHSYLKAGAYELGLLINFNVPVLKHGLRRIVRQGADADLISSL